MTDALTAHTQASETLLGAAMREPVRNQLLVALADAHNAAGEGAAGAGLRDRACQHFARAMDCARAGNDLLRVVVNLDNLGRLELRVEPNEALKFFQLCAGASVPLARALPLKHLGVGLPHVEGCTYLVLGHFDRAVMTLAAAVDGTSHKLGCSMGNFAYLAAAQLRCGELRAGLITAERVVTLARSLRSVLVRGNLVPLQQAAAARRDSACQDLARELATLRGAA